MDKGNAESFQRNNLFETIFSEAPMGIALIDRAGTYLRINSAWERLTGYSREELLHKTFKTITPKNYIPLSEQKLSALMSGAIEAYTIEKSFLRKDGSTFWANVSVKPIKNEAGEIEMAIAIIDDITALKNVERELAERQELLMAIFEKATIGVGVITNDGCFSFSNSYVRDMLAYTEEEFTGLDIRTLVIEKDRSAFLKMFEQIRTKRVENAELKLIRKDHRIIEVKIDSYPIQLGMGSSGLAVLLFRDITMETLKRTQEKLIYSQLKKITKDLIEFSKNFDKDADLSAVKLADFGMTDRECEIIHLMLQGYQNREIAEKVFLAEITVRKHITSIYKKLNIKNRYEFLEYFRDKLIE